ncbi:mevalonate kinase [Sandaracinus amylolyticus]|uniref:mevalonate kinase family protein n=1 Tax=Sandaracinus amylolyticus TaxID=927083 RepID=UPI003AF3D984
MVSGEYVVLEGAPAVVAAVSARARIRLLPGSADSAACVPPEAIHARRLAEAAFGAVPGALSVDASPLRDGARKLGLGSSAAGAAGTVAAVAAAHGIDIDGVEYRARELLPLALAGHRAVAPEGSGADIAASMLGGFVRFERRGEDVDARPLEWPSSLRTMIVWTGMPVRTSDMIHRVKQLAATEPKAYARIGERLADAARALLSAIERGDVGKAIEAAGEHGAAMHALGAAAGAPIVTDELSAIAKLARDVNGAAKPSGAGGGDVAIAFVPDERAASELARACDAAGWRALDLRLGDDGPQLAPRG